MRIICHRREQKDPISIQAPLLYGGNSVILPRRQSCLAFQRNGISSERWDVGGVNHEVVWLSTAQGLQVCPSSREIGTDNIRNN